MGSGYRELGLREREAAVRPRRLVVRHLRRLLLPRPGHRRRRRRRLRRRGGDVPHQVRRLGHPRPPPRRAARQQDHGRPGRRQRQDLASRGTARSPTSSATTKVSGLRLRDTVTGDERDIDVTGLFVAIGHDPRSELLEGQVELDDEGYVLVQGRTTLTNVDGVFACGDLVDHTYRQAITAAGSGCAPRSTPSATWQPCSRTPTAPARRRRPPDPVRPATHPPDRPQHPPPPRGTPMGSPPSPSPTPASTPT